MRRVHAYKIKIRSEVRELHTNFTMFSIDLKVEGSGEKGRGRGRGGQSYRCIINPLR